MQTPILRYLREHNMSVAAFARWLGCDKSVAYRWVHYGRLPDIEYLEKIYRLTEGAITPNDFYDFIQAPPPPQPEITPQLQHVNGKHLADLPLADAPPQRTRRRRR